jgi:membrane-bound lytic murein transglycosylase B
MTPEEMRGAWAGEIGQTQFMPSSYINFAVDFDNNGRRDLIRSVPSVNTCTIGICGKPFMSFAERH